jgi:hypothetical protein
LKGKTKWKGQRPRKWIPEKLEMLQWLLKEQFNMTPKELYECELLHELRFDMWDSFPVLAKQTVPPALWHFLRRWDEPADCLAAAVGSGGDADSIGTTCGALLGALHGTGWMRSDWFHQLENNEYGRDRLVQVAKDLYRIFGVNSSTPCDPRKHEPPKTITPQPSYRHAPKVCSTEDYNLLLQQGYREDQVDAALELAAGNSQVAHDILRATTPPLWRLHS